MSDQLSTIRISRRYGAPPARIFDAWLDPHIAGKWLFATASRPMSRVAIDARVEGSFRFVERRDGEVIRYTGVYSEITPPRRLVFTLSADPQSMHATRVTVEIAPSKEGSEINLIHERVPLRHASRTEGRWTGILYGLGALLDANLDGRKGIGKKPRLPENLLSNSANAKRLQATGEDNHQLKEIRP